MAKITPKVAAAMSPAIKLSQPRRRPRGRPFEKGHKLGFEKGQSGNPGGKPKVFQKFSAAVMEKMLQPVPKDVKAKLGLGRGATMYDAMIAALLLNAAHGDTTAFTTARETVEGRLVQKNVNISASLEALQNDSNFVEWLESQHAQYLLGGNQNGRQTLEAIARGLPEPTDAEDIPTD